MYGQGHPLVRRGRGYLTPGEPYTACQRICEEIWGPWFDFLIYQLPPSTFPPPGHPPHAYSSSLCPHRECAEMAAAESSCSGGGSKSSGAVRADEGEEGSSCSAPRPGLHLVVLGHVDVS